MARKALRQLRKGAIGLTGGAVVLGVGSSVVAGVGGPVGGLTAAAGFLPVLGGAIGAGVTVSALRGLQPRKRRRR